MSIIDQQCCPYCGSVEYYPIFDDCSLLNFDCEDCGGNFEETGSRSNFNNFDTEENES